ncbi:glycosyltransferase family 2 protein [Marinilactibacillus sp. GCM10026970]|uniref:glycosyltransferase family 2 protein n=1 Tax=Marinilactibacillus sp. GCM10026970 TaxID=3252642 RepID=UPI0036170536
MNEKISVIITTYGNRIDYLDKALRSVLNQTYRNTEIIIIDDNGLSSINQLKVSKLLNNYNNKNIKYIPNKKNVGAQISRNLGLKEASGEFIAYLDDDDEWLLSKLEDQYNTFKNYKSENLGLVYCWYNEITTRNNKVSSKLIKRKEYDDSFSFSMLLRSNYIGSTSFPLIKTSVLERLNGFDEEMMAQQDYELWLRISKEFSIKCINKPLCNYNSHKGERITSNPHKKIDSIEKIIKKYFIYYEKDPQALSLKYKVLTIQYLRAKELKTALKYLWKNYKIKPFNLNITLSFIKNFLLIIR